MIRLEKVNAKTFDAVIGMKLSKEQSEYVAPNVASLAEAWLCYDNARPMAILNDEEVVGFIMLDYDLDERSVGIWRLLIDNKYQHKGFGRKALEIVIDMARKDENIDIMYLDYVPGNEVARRLYTSLGFRENGKIVDDEIVMTLPLTDNPKIGIVKADEDDISEILDEVKEQEDTKLASLTEDILEDLIDEDKLYRITLLTQNIGLSWDDDVIMYQEYKNLYLAAYSKIVK